MVDEDSEKMNAITTYVELMNKASKPLKVLQDNDMACVRCHLEHTCQYAYDFYNFNTEPLVDCLEAK
jgi:hypothetical protein